MLLVVDYWSKRVITSNYTAIEIGSKASSVGNGVVAWLNVCISSKQCPKLRACIDLQMDSNNDNIAIGCSSFVANIDIR